MALLLHTGPNMDAVVQTVTTVQVQMQTPPTVTYRCVACGDVLHFNALSASCRCIDECYSESANANPSG